MNESSECSLSKAVVRLQKSWGGESKRIKKHFFLSIDKVHFRMQLKSNEHLRKPMPQYIFIVTGVHNTS